MSVVGGDFNNEILQGLSQRVINDLHLQTLLGSQTLSCLKCNSLSQWTVVKVSYKFEKYLCHLTCIYTGLTYCISVYSLHKYMQRLRERSPLINTEASSFSFR